ncbi:MAG: methanogen output domain 1-containing protein [Methanosarcinales archaeon]|nr:methanogen output domain 1-containing protein [Methanosarcinales archaeon]
MHDNLMVERDRLDIKNSILSVLTQIIPILMQTVPPQQQGIVIHQIIDRVEQIISDKLELELETMDMAYVGNKICDLWYQLGGSFTVNSEGDKKITIKGTECPWGNEARNNPTLCQLTRGIFSRIAIKKSPYVEVQLVKLLGNRDDCCLIEIIQ